MKIPKFIISIYCFAALCLLNVPASKQIVNSNVDEAFYGEEYVYSCDEPLTSIPSTCPNIFSFYYFYNLYNNLCQNIVKNCGYTATAMLLSYLDSYLNDNIIGESYENTARTVLNGYNDLVTGVDSPGVEKVQPGIYHDEEYILNHTEGLPSYNEVINGYRMSQEQLSLFQNLIYEQMDCMYTDGIYLGYLYKFAFDNHVIGYKSTQNSVRLGFGVVPSIMRNLFTSLQENTILSNLVDVDVKNENIGGETKSSIRASIINRLINGIPVAVGGGLSRSNGDSGGHLAVAYYYDAINDKIYGNLGYCNNNRLLTHVNLEAFLI